MAIVMVTGCAGFIGREVCHQLYLRGDHIVGVDKCTYAARPELLNAYRDRLKLVEQDVRSLDRLHDASVVYHLAGETHVCNSIEDSAKFIETNVMGTHRLLELIRAKREHERPLLVHISTDEVFGSVGPESESVEEDPFEPSSPYSASKAAAEHLVRAWATTYGIRARIVRPSNCFGHDQFPEKLIPRAIRCLQLGRPIPVHGDGTQSRQWLHVEECAKAILLVADQGLDGESYNLPGGSEVKVRDIVNRIVELYHGEVLSKHISYGWERPGGDRRYKVNGDRMAKLGWKPQRKLWDDLPELTEAGRKSFRL